MTAPCADTRLLLPGGGWRSGFLLGLEARRLALADLHTDALFARRAFRRLLGGIGIGACLERAVDPLVVGIPGWHAWCCHRRALLDHAERPPHHDAAFRIVTTVTSGTALSVRDLLRMPAGEPDAVFALAVGAGAAA